MNQTNYGGTNYQVNTGENNTNIFHPEPDVPIVGIPQNLPRTHVKAFVGRSEELTQLHEQLQQSNCLAIASIAGMGGIGKTELALQYALHHLQQATYPGGLCWLRARESEVGTQIVNFARSRLGLKLPEGLDLDNQIGFCWQHWREGEVLLILDDVTDYSLVKPYLPSDSRFKILLTTRLQLGQSFQQLEIKVLDEAAALELLKSLTDADRIDGQLEAAKYLCEWLGYLPLALELVGRYLAQKPDLTLTEMVRRLEAKRLDANALRQVEDGMTAQLGIAAAFELSWQELDAAAQELCYLLSLFALAPIQWQWVEQCFPDRDPEDLEDIRDRQLIRLSLLERSNKQTFLLHQLIREFLQAKLRRLTGMDSLKQRFCQTLIEEAGQITASHTTEEIYQIKVHEFLTKEQVLGVTLSIPHIAEIGKNLTDYLDEEHLLLPFIGVANFYRARVEYTHSLFWYEQGLSAVKTRYGEEHPFVTAVLNSLAIIYTLQGQYKEAETLCIEALKLIKRVPMFFSGRILSINSEEAIVSLLNNLGLVYKEQGRYKEAESCLIEAFELNQYISDRENVYTLSNLAHIYMAQKQYDRARFFLVKEHTLLESTTGKEHPYFAGCLNDLAELYRTQQQYQVAELLQLESLNLSKRLLGEEHPDLAKSMNNLALIYESQERYESAEEMFLKACDLTEQTFGREHPNLQQYYTT